MEERQGPKTEGCFNESDCHLQASPTLGLTQESSRFLGTFWAHHPQRASSTSQFLSSWVVRKCHLSQRKLISSLLCPSSLDFYLPFPLSACLSCLFCIFCLVIYPLKQLWLPELEIIKGKGTNEEPSRWNCGCLGVSNDSPGLMGQRTITSAVKWRREKLIEKDKEQERELNLTVLQVSS